jgi:hypothetical protein
MRGIRMMHSLSTLTGVDVSGDIPIVLAALIINSESRDKAFEELVSQIHFLLNLLDRERIL